MANTKISQLAAGAPALATDLIPIARAGTNVSLKVSDVLAAAFPVVVLHQTVTGITATDAAHETTFTPVAGACYQSQAILTVTASGAGGSTMTIQTLMNAGDTSGLVPSSGLGNTTVGDCKTSIGGAFTVSTLKTMGWTCVLTGTIGTATYQVDFFVTRLS